MEQVWVEFYRKMKATNSALEKKLLVQKYPQLAEIWKLILNRSTYVTPASIAKYQSNAKRRRVDVNYDLLQLLQKLSTRELTGNAALDNVTSYLAKYPDMNEELTAVISGVPKLGLNGKSINQAYVAAGLEKVLSEFNVCLAQPFEPVDYASDTWFIMRKYDGIRCIIEFQADKITPFTRNGNPITSIQKAVSQLTPPSRSVCIDCEIVIPTADSKDDFTASLSRLRQTKVDVADFQCNVFDLLTVDDFYMGESKQIYSERLENARRFCENLRDPRFVVIECEKYASDEVFTKWQAKRDVGKWEGLILRKDAPYKGTRTSDLLKVKEFKSMEVVVKDISIGYKQMLNASGIMEDMRIMSAAIIQHEGTYVSVGSGWNDRQRLEYVKNPERIIGKTIEINYFEQSTSKSGKHSLRFPTLKSVWGERRDM
uniref:ATP-dependent DNA ligase family profile domain-containing protein n=1 Tax=viral metagenome TaxID=1070528 RepID=A0A6C0CM89_9ZZZZ